MKTKTETNEAKFDGNLWQTYHVKLKLRDRLIGGYPKNPEAEAAMLRARGLEDLIPKPQDPATMSEEQAETAKTAAIERSSTGFKSNGAGIYLESRQIKAMLKESANVLKNNRLLDIKQLKSKLAERVFVYPDHIRLGAGPDGTDQRVVHVMTAQGPRSSIKFFDYLNEPEIEFHLKVLKDNVVTESVLRTILEYAQENGLGADRSQGFGQFDLVEFAQEVSA
jgi:CRISPR/Cas system CSM-associated protein Csm4 (group 5 of RAMP superfamily)